MSELNFEPYVVVMATFPTHKVEELIKRSPEAMKKYPRDAVGSKHILTLHKRSDEGYTNISITKPLEGKLDAELKHQMKRQHMYDGIEGYESRVEVYYEITLDE